MPVRRSVHPHPRGKHARCVATSSSAAGSPPPAWEAQLRRRGHRPRPRFTPTRVGSTPNKEKAPWSSTVHPHPRGKHAAASPRTPRGGGSPPPAWEARPSPRRAPGRRRFTPTRVGSTCRCSRPGTAAAVHPHPRPRFTPTRVGSTHMAARLRRMAAVHPHPRGKHARGASPAPGGGGSPPPAWEAHDFLVHPVGGVRFTPTRVGSTTAARTRRTARSVHPHPRGKHSLAPGGRMTVIGSPPPAWEALRGAPLRAHRPRFTPTRVGSTRAPAGGAGVVSVHPHPRGKHPS